jgi:hypothetical protein
MNLSEDNLIELLQSVARIEQNLQTLNAAVLGNGKKGLQERIESLETRWAWIAGIIFAVTTGWEFVKSKFLGSGH